MIEHWTAGIVGFLGIVLLIWGALARPSGATPREPGKRWEWLRGEHPAYTWRESLPPPRNPRPPGIVRPPPPPAPPLPPRIFVDTITLPRQRGNDPERERMLEELRHLQARVRRLEGNRE